MKRAQKTQLDRLFIILLALMVCAMILPSCKKKKNTSSIDLEAIDYDGSKNERYLFREELKKEKLKKEKEKNLLKKIEEEVPK